MCLSEDEIREKEENSSKIIFGHRKQNFNLQLKATY